MNINRGLTVGQLYVYVKEQIEKGNRDKYILISSDDEGNNFHNLFYQFTEDKEEIKSCLNSNSVANDIILLG